MAKIRVLVVKNSPKARKRICEILAADSDLEIIGEAENGEQAIKLCETLRPDVITMGLLLPIMNCLAATEYIMAHCPTPILVISDPRDRGDLFNNSAVYAAGALLVLDKYNADGNNNAWESNLISTIWLLAHSRAITRAREPAITPPAGKGMQDRPKQNNRDVQ